MASVGVRELRSSLSRYLKRVREGEIIEVTERGRPIARIMPAGIDERAATLVAEGRASWSGKRAVPPARPVRPNPGGKLASDYISEDRGD